MVAWPLYYCIKHAWHAGMQHAIRGLTVAFCRIVLQSLGVWGINARVMPPRRIDGGHPVAASRVISHLWMRLVTAGVTSHLASDFPRGKRFRTLGIVLQYSFTVHHHRSHDHTLRIAPFNRISTMVTRFCYFTTAFALASRWLVRLRTRRGEKPRLLWVSS